MPRPRRKIPISVEGAYAKLQSSQRAGGTTHYLKPEVLRRISVPGGGELQLEALRALDGSEPIIRWTAAYVVDHGDHKAHCTAERYLQVPHHGFDVLEQPDAAREIEAAAKAMIENIATERARTRAERARGGAAT